MGAPARSKRLWRVLKLTLLLVARKGLISKRRFLMDMNLMIKRGKIFRKSVSDFVFHHHHDKPSGSEMARGRLGLQDYEFSCNNTPINPVFSYLPKRCRKSHSYFPCINLPEETNQENQEANEEGAIAAEYSVNQLQSPVMEGSSLFSPYSVRISDCCSEEEEGSGSEDGEVDNQAEEFIRRFYEQLRMQRRLQY